MSRLEWLLALDERNNVGRKWFRDRFEAYPLPHLPLTGITVAEAKAIVAKALNPKLWAKSARQSVVKYAGSRQLPEAKKGSELGQLARTKNRCEE